MLQYPVLINDRIKTFEKENNLIINIFCLENEDNPKSLIAPCRLSPILANYYQLLVANLEQAKQQVTKEQFEMFQSSMLKTLDKSNLINLFLYKGHYMLIKSFSRLISTQLSNNHKNKLHICYKCLYHTTSDNYFVTHLRYCSNNNVTHTRLPKIENNKLFFKNQQKEIKVPFIVYADFESVLKPAEENHPLNSEQRKILNTHIPAAYGFHIASPVTTFQPHIYLGENADKKFAQDILRTLVTADDSIYNKYFKNKYKNFPVSTVPPTKTHIAASVKSGLHKTM